METGSPTNGPDRIDPADREFVQSAGSPGADRGMETDRDPVFAPQVNRADNHDFIKEIAGAAVDAHNDAIRREFTSAAERIGIPQDAGSRIAERATMQPATRETVTEYTAQLAAKYNVARFITAEGALALALIAHWRNLSASRKELADLAKRYAPSKIAQAPEDS